LPTSHAHTSVSEKSLPQFLTIPASLRYDQSFKHQTKPSADTTAVIVATVLRHQLALWNRDGQTQDYPFVPVRFENLRRFVTSNALGVNLRELVIADILQRHPPRIASEPAEWRVNPNLLKGGLTQYSVQTKALQRKLLKSRLEISEPTELEQHLFRMLPKLEIERTQAEKWVIGLPFTKQLQANDSIGSIASKQHYLSRDKNGRLYSHLTSLRKDLRKFLTVGGERLSEIDVCCFQPLLLSGLVVDAVGEHPDTVSFREMCQTGDFYSHIQTHCGLRDKGKLGFLSYLNGHPAQLPKLAVPIQKMMRENFPHVDKFVTDTKRWDYTAMSKLLMRWERRIVVDGGARRFVTETSGERFVGTVHDCLIVTTSDADIVANCLTEAFGEFGLTPQLAVKPL
jgi:hypothetical protein